MVAGGIGNYTWVVDNGVGAKGYTYMNITKFLSDNKHTSIAAGVYLLASLFAQLGVIWFPDHKDQFSATVNTIKEFAVTYGLVMAGDAQRGKDAPAPNPTDVPNQAANKG